MNPVVSIVMPCYNAEAFVGEALRSTMGQGMPACEIFVIDDGSTDRSVLVAREVSAEVRIISQGKNGVAAARNRGIAEARGEWIAFLDADDIWELNKLEKQLAKAAEGYDFVYCDAANFGDCRGLPRNRGEYCEFPEGDVFAKLLGGNFIVTSGVMMHRSLLDRIGRFRQEFSPAEDWGLWLEAATVGRFGCVREPLVRYRVHSAGLSRNAEEMVAGCVAVLEWAKGHPRAKEVPAGTWRRAAANVRGVGGLVHERAGRRLAALRQHAYALVLEPDCGQRWKNLARAALGIR